MRSDCRTRVVWAASCDRNFGGMLANSFEHSEIRIAFQQAASEVTIYSALHSVPSKVQHCHSTLGLSPHIRKHINSFYKKSGKVCNFCFLFHYTQYIERSDMPLWTNGTYRESIASVCKTNQQIGTTNFHI